MIKNNFYMKHDNIKRMIREEVRRAVRLEMKKISKRMKIVIELPERDEAIPDTEPDPLMAESRSEENF
jgi:hypothetical protein